MEVARAVLQKWFSEGHRALLFSQTIQMLNFIETMVQSEGLTYRRIDGTVSMTKRHLILREFDQNKVGGSIKHL